MKKFDNFLKEGMSFDPTSSSHKTAAKNLSSCIQENLDFMNNAEMADLLRYYADLLDKNNRRGLKIVK